MSQNTAATLGLDIALAPTPQQQGAQFANPGTGLAGSQPGPGRVADTDGVPPDPLALGYPINLPLPSRPASPAGWTTPARQAQVPLTGDQPGRGSQWPAWHLWTQT